MNRRWPAVIGLACLFAVGADAVGRMQSPGSVDAALNFARLQGCGDHAGLVPLRDELHLRDAARRLASGTSLHAALAASGYLARQSFELKVSGVQSDAQLRQVLVKNFCQTLTDSSVRDFGVERRGDNLWITLATPLVLPAVRDAVAIETQVLQLVNVARASGRHCGSRRFAPAPVLSYSAALTRAAQTHSEDMAAHGEFEHRGHDGSSPALRVTRSGFGAYRIVGENIAAGATSAADVTQGWLNSVPHCENIMDPRFAQMGVAFRINTARDAVIYWTQDFATPAAVRDGTPGQ